MGLFQNEIQIVEKSKNNKPEKIKFKCLNGYESMRRNRRT